MAKLRSSSGCPWDREQTPQSIRKHLLEEACEAIDAIEEGDARHLQEELGDLLLQIIFQAQMASEAGLFDIEKVITGIINKLIRRHPHVFAGLKVNSSQEVIANWQKIKSEEKKRTSHLEDVPRSLPSLFFSQKLQEKAAEVGFDWQSAEDILPKLHEEISEFTKARTATKNKHEEFGDILFTLVNLARHLGIDAETALRSSANKFINRFQKMEKAAAKQGKSFSILSSAEKEKLWQATK
jgi:tetrapyrrole methylase family protein/MazG family protein